MSYYMIWIDEQVTTSSNCRNVDPNAPAERSTSSRVRGLVETLLDRLIVQVRTEGRMAIIVEDDAP